MAIRPRWLRPAAVMTLVLQLIAAFVVAIGACTDLPHMHGATPTPECLMHHSRAASTGQSAHHDHHGQHGTNQQSSRIACQCSPDPLLFLIGETGVLAEPVAVPDPLPVVSTALPLATAVVDGRIPPLSPPPRIPLA